MLASYSSRCDQYHIITDKYVWCYNKKWMKQYHYVQVLWFRRMRRRSSWRKNQEKGSSTIIVNNMEKEQRRRGRKIIFWGYCREATNISCRDIVPMSMNGTIYISICRNYSPLLCIPKDRGYSARKRIKWCIE